jgi:hypothetical protein
LRTTTKTRLGSAEDERAKQRIAGEILQSVDSVLNVKVCSHPDVKARLTLFFATELENAITRNAGYHRGPVRFHVEQSTLITGEGTPPRIPFNNNGEKNDTSSNRRAIQKASDT